MKNKLIISVMFLIGSLSLGYSKTEEELMSGIPESNEQNRAARVAYVMSNKDDILPLFNKWKDTSAGKYMISEKPNSNLTQEQKDLASRQRDLYAPFYYKFAYELDNVNDNCAIRLSPSVYLRIKGEDEYQKIKQNDWKIEETPLPFFIRIELASIVGDQDYLCSLSAKDVGNVVLLQWATQMCRYLPAQSDMTAAYNKAVEIETALMGLPKSFSGTSEVLNSIREVQDILYLRINRAKNLK